MLDKKIYTFLKLCELMNYRETAKILNMTQPAVTQHIQMLEAEYRCKLFTYTKKKLSKTAECNAFEAYARSSVYNEKIIRKKVLNMESLSLRLGATKTIGDYVIVDKVESMVLNEDLDFSLVIDNTEKLLNMLDRGELDVSVIEGFFDKGKYDYKLFRKEKFVGICSANHRFAGRDVTFDELFEEHIIIREEGSGTRAILEQLLIENSFTLSQFEKVTSVSSFNIIKQLVSKNKLISFAYESIAKSQDNIASFTIVDKSISREFNFVYLKDTEAGEATTELVTKCDSNQSKYY